MGRRDALVGALEPPEEAAQRLIDNFLLLRGKMESSGFDAATFWRGLSLLDVALVELDAADGPQAVFESLNSKGMALSTADRVRNFIVASADGDDQERLFRDAWLPLEERAAGANPPTSTASPRRCAWVRFPLSRLFDIVARAPLTLADVKTVYEMRL